MLTRLGATSARRLDLFLPRDDAKQNSSTPRPPFLIGKSVKSRTLGVWIYSIYSLKHVSSKRPHQVILPRGSKLPCLVRETNPLPIPCFEVVKASSFRNLLQIPDPVEFVHLLHPSAQLKGIVFFRLIRRPCACHGHGSVVGWGWGWGGEPSDASDAVTGRTCLTVFPLSNTKICQLSSNMKGHKKDIKEHRIHNKSRQGQPQD